MIKDLGLKEPYVGRIDLVSGEIGEDLTAYFFLSEQQPSSVALGVKINTGLYDACGRRHDHPDAAGGQTGISGRAGKAAGEMDSISSLIGEIAENSAGKTEKAVLDSLLDRIFKPLPEEFAVERLEYRDIKWDCDCSIERLEQVVISIGSKDLQEIIEEDEKAELTCQFCGSKYQFDKEHLERLLKESMQREGKSDVERI